jgi:predicted exporter
MESSSRLKVWRHKPFTFFTLISVAFALVYSLWHWNLNVSIEKFLPLGSKATLARSFTHSALARTIVLNIGGSTLHDRIEAAQFIKHSLQDNPEVERIVSGVDAKTQEEFFKIYFPRRQYFISMAPEREIPQLLSEDGLRKRALELKRLLGQPTGGLVRQIATRDPLLLFLRHTDRLTHNFGHTLPTHEGQLLTKDRRYAVLFVTTRHSAFSTSHQKPFLASLSQLWNTVNHKYHNALVLEYSGIHRFAVKAEHDIKRDLQLLSGLSTVATLIIFYLVFLSLRTLVLVWIPIVVGTMCAMGATLAVFGNLHGITLAFGTALIGVCIDYSTHYYNHESLYRSQGAPGVGSLRMPLTIGAVTTIFGFASLVFLDIPGVRQMAFFASVGVIVALLTTLFTLSEWKTHERKPSFVQQTLLRFSEVLFRFLTPPKNRLIVLMTLGSCALAALSGLPFLRWDTSLAAFHPPDPTLLAQEQTIRARSSVMDSSRVILTTARSEQQLLAQSDALTLALEDAKRANELEGYRDISPWLWSAALQQRNQRALLQPKHLTSLLDIAYKDEGFRTENFDFRQAITAQAPPLTLSDLITSNIGSVIEPHITRFNHGLVLAVFLKDVKNPKALAHRVSQIPDTTYFDHTATLRTAYERYRTQILVLIGVGFVVIFFILLLRYRSTAKVTAAFLPAIVAAGASLGMLAWFGIPLTLMHALAIVLILSMGEDYGIFLAETDLTQPESRITFTSVLLTGISTIVTFGVLTFSSIPALRAIGMTTSIGMTWSLILAPAAFVIANPISKHTRQ